MSGPNPDLLEAYGTDELYFSNLEKRAADTIFGARTMALSRGDFGRTGIGRVDRFRAEADLLNQRFRVLEAQIMANTTENLGGPGTRRSAFTRAMMTQPYAVHPLMYTAALGAGPGGVMPPPGMVHAPAAHGELPLHPEEADLSSDISAEMARTASVSTAVAARLGMRLAHLSKEAQMGANPSQPELPMPPPPTIGQDFRQAGGELGAGAAHLGRGITRSFGKAMDVGGGLFQRMGRGLEGFMMSERRTTPRWGTGIAPAKDVNEFGIPIY